MAELPPEPLLPASVLHGAAGILKSGDTPEVARADQARTIHLRRQLEAAAEHGASLLAALGLPRLIDVAPGISRVDPVAADNALNAEFTGIDPIAAGDALDQAIAALDALDDDVDLEDGADDEFTGDDELSLGWRERVRQVDLGIGQDDGEPTLGAPERHPFVSTMSAPHYKPADGSYWRARNWESQASWAQGSRLDGEGEACIGYDIGDDSTPDEDGLSRPWLCEDRVIGLRVEGDCCAPHILDGGAVHVDKDAKPVAGDFVAIFFESWQDGRQCMRGWVKRLSMNLPPNMRWPFYAAPGNKLSPVLMVESLNPSRRYQLDVTKVHAVFKVVRVLPPPQAIVTRDLRSAART